MSWEGRKKAEANEASLYVQGSFLSITETPHPLDAMPIPIEVHHGAFTALPKLTLQAGLAQSIMPGTLGHYHPNHDLRAAPDDFRPPPTGALSPKRVDAPVTSRPNRPKGRWRERKKAGLTVRVDGHRTRSHGALKTPRSAASSRALRPALKRGTAKRGLESVKAFQTLSDLGAGWARGVLHPLRGKGAAHTARRVSFGGLEMR
ncbi:hypothetical protein EHS25_001560 [Saitozyma podzolica]|uniref:Uncharacterized protein n=1 Tax=Saitozyma podzolica TaxID=1890683 RepID=A0A427YGJ7_9TREE|nr:hypothetical protein EHS25_001560 [Saitozyma podzolica]